MVSTGSKGIKGPFLDEEGVDLLDLVEHLIDLSDNQAIMKFWQNRRDGKETSQMFIQDLILLDIARSLRKLSEAPALRSPYRSKYSSSGF